MSHLCPYLLCTIEGHRISGASGDRGDIAIDTGSKRKENGNKYFLKAHYALGPAVRVSAYYSIYASSAINIMT